MIERKEIIQDFPANSPAIESGRHWARIVGSAQFNTHGSYLKEWISFNLCEVFSPVSTGNIRCGSKLLKNSRPFLLENFQIFMLVDSRIVQFKEWEKHESLCNNSLDSSLKSRTRTDQQQIKFPFQLNQEHFKCYLCIKKTGIKYFCGLMMWISSKCLAKIHNVFLQRILFYSSAVKKSFWSMIQLDRSAKRSLQRSYLQCDW